MYEGGYNLNEQVSDAPPYWATEDNYVGDGPVEIPNEPESHPGPGTPSTLKITGSPNRVMPHTHLGWYDQSAEAFAEHLVGAHGCSKTSVTVLYEQGGIGMVAYHVRDHGDDGARY